MGPQDFLRRRDMDAEHSSTRMSANVTEVPLDTQNSPNSVTCPKCRAKIPLTQALKAEFEEQANARMESEMRRREADLRADAERAIATASTKAEARTKDALAS